MGGSVGAFFVLQEPAGAVTATLHVTQVRPGRAGLDLSLGTLPMAAAEGALVLLPSAGLGFALAGSGATLLPRGGVTALMGVSGDGGVVNPGLYGGAGLLLGGAERHGMRIDLSRVRYLDSSQPYWCLSVGFTSLPGRGAAER